MTTPIYSQGVSIFDTSTADPVGLIPLQTDPGSAQVTGIERATNMLVPDAPTSQQLKNFPENLYDLRDTSVLVRLMKVLLGDAGAGQLRKRTLITRMEAYLAGARFFDLDRFYGAIFGALRTPEEALTVNPMDSVATPDEWDALMAADAAFQGRIFNMAQGIAQGATIPGLKQVAEAIVDAEVDIYESWQFLDAYGSYLNPTPNTWTQVQTTWPNWSSFASTDTWNVVEGTIVVGRTNTLTRSEIVVRPKKEYDNSATTTDTYPVDQNALIRVLQKLRPAGTIVTVDPNLGIPHQVTPISGLVADSEFWEVVPKVTPATSVASADTYPLSAGQSASGAQVTDQRILPRPPYSASGGRSWSYNSLVTSVKSYNFAAPDPSDTADPQDATPSVVSDDQTVVYRDGLTVQYTALKGLQNARLTAAASAIADGVLVAHPYTADRKAVPTHD